MLLRPSQPATVIKAPGHCASRMHMACAVLFVVVASTVGGVMADESDPCAAERSACDQTDCKALLLCVQGCLDAACIEDCQSSEVSSQAHSQLRELQECVRDSGQRARSAPAAAQGKDGATQRPVTRERARMARNRGGAGTVGAQRSGAAPPGDDGATESAVAKLARAMRSTASQLHQDAALASQEQIPASEVGSAKTLARRRAAAKARQHRRLRVRHRGHLRSFMRGAAAAAWGERQQQGGEQDEGEEDDSYDPELDGPEEGEEQGEEQGGQGGGDQDQGSGADEGAEGSGSDYDPELDDPPEGGEEDESDLPPVFSRADGTPACPDARGEATTAIPTHCDAKVPPPHAARPAPVHWVPAHVAGAASHAREPGALAPAEVRPCHQLGVHARHSGCRGSCALPTPWEGRGEGYNFAALPC